MISTILVAVDGSEHAHRAVDFAADLAAIYKARLVLLHVLLRGDLAGGLEALPQIERTTGEDLGAALADIEAESRAGGKKPAPTAPSRAVLDFLAKKIIASAEKTARAKGVKLVHSTVEDGDPAKRIIECAERENADVVVVGTRGLSDAEGLLVGSTSHKVTHLCPRTCITVK